MYGDKIMNNTSYEVTLPEIALLAITRVTLGAGIGLLFAHRLRDARRAAAGWALLTIGIVTTVPIAVEVLGGQNPRRTPKAKQSTAMGQ